MSSFLNNSRRLDSMLKKNEIICVHVVCRIFQKKANTSSQEYTSMRMMEYMQRKLCIFVCIFLLFSSLSPVFSQGSDSGNVVVTGTVAPKASSIVFDFQSTAADLVNQDVEIKYTITYSSNHAQNMPVVIQADWGKATITGASEPTVYVADFVSGSATKAEGGTDPIIDFQNKKITWTIPSLPAGVQGKKVSFTLKTNSLYSGPERAIFPVNARILVPSGIPDKTIQKSFQYLKKESISSPTPTPILSPLPSSVAQNSIEVKKKPLTISAVSSKSLGAVSIKIGFDVSRPTSMKLEYGERPQNFTNAIILPETSRQTAVLSQLSPSTTYYFKISSYRDKESFESDIYTFTTTSETSVVPKAEVKTLIVMQERQVIYSSNPTQNVENTEFETQTQAQSPIVVTKNSVVDFNINIPTPEKVKQAELFFQEAGVLGISSEEDRVNVLQSSVSKLTNTSGESFAGKLRTPIVPGTYQVMIRIEDWHGNIEEKDLGLVKVLQPFQVFSEKDQKGINRAKVTFYKYNEQTKLYEMISNVSGIAENPTYSNLDGVVDFSISKGKYKASILASHFEPKDVFFEITDNVDQSLPKILLIEKKGITIDFSDASISLIRFFDGISGLFKNLILSSQLYTIVLFIAFIFLFIMLFEEKVLQHFGVYNIEEVIRVWTFKTGGVSSLGKVVMLFLFEVFSWILRFYVILWLIFGVAYVIYADVLKGLFVIFPTLMIIFFSGIHGHKFMKENTSKKNHLL